MTDEASPEAAGATAGGLAAPMPNATDKLPAVPPAAMPPAHLDTPPGVGFALRIVPKATAAERLAREEGMARALALGARPYRDAEGKGRHIPFKEANLAAVEPWIRDPRAKRGYRRTQELRKAAGQLIGQPGDKIEIAKRLGALHWEQGSDIEGAARRGLYDAIWSREHVYDTFTVPRRTGRTLIDTGRVAAVVEEEGRKIQAEDPEARGGFWVRDRNDFGLLYVVPNADPEEEAERQIIGREGDVALVGDADDPGQAVTAVAAPDAASPAAIPDQAGNSEPDDVSEEDFQLPPVAELELLRQLGVDVDAPTLPGSKVHALKEATSTRLERPVPRDTLEAIAQGFEREWERLQKKGIRHYVPPELRDLYDAVPSARELADIAASLLPGSGEAQSLLDYNEAANRFVERLGAGDVAGARQAAADTLTGLAGAIPVAGRAGRLPDAAQRFARASEVAKKAKRIPSRRPLQVVLEKTPGRNEAGRLRQIRVHARRNLPGGFLEQSASQALAKTYFPPRTPIENVQRGLAAVDVVIEQALRGEAGVLVNAMNRRDVGPITFLFGKPGVPDKKYRKGGGLSHIIAKHGPEVLDDMVETIAKGIPIQQRGQGTGERIVLLHRGHEVVLSLYRGQERETWLLTGYKTGVSDINFDLSQLNAPIFFKAN